MNLSERYDDVGKFEILLSDCSVQAEGDWEVKFVLEMKARYESYRERMFISDKQLAVLQKISKKREPPIQTQGGMTPFGTSMMPDLNE